MSFITIRRFMSPKKKKGINYWYLCVSFCFQIPNLCEKIFLLAHSPDDRNCWSQVRAKTGTWNSIWFPMWTGEMHALGNCLLLPQACKQGEGLEAEQPGLKLALMGSWRHRQQFSQLQLSACPRCKLLYNQSTISLML